MIVLKTPKGFDNLSGDVHVQYRKLPFSWAPIWRDTSPNFEYLERGIRDKARIDGAVDVCGLQVINTIDRMVVE